MLTDRLGWHVRPELIEAWESRIAPPADALLTAEELAWTAGESDHASSMQSFRVADVQVGGGHLYDTVVTYLKTSVAPRLVSVDHGRSPSTFTAASALIEMAGWMAHDAGNDRTAAQHFSRSLDLARLSDDKQLEVHILTSVSHLAHHRRDAQAAVRYAQRGHDLLAGGPRRPELEARTLALQARGHAARGMAGDCARLLLEAERALDTDPDEERSPWVSPFDHGSLACEAARCLRQLGDLTQARRHAERVVELRPTDRTRSRAFGQLILATVQIAQGRPDEACTVAREVLSGTQRLASFLVTQQLLDLEHALEPYRGVRVVADFLDHLDEAMGGRVRLARLQGDRNPAGFREQP